MEYVFHGSNIQNLELLCPKKTLLINRPLIYASVNFYIASLFLDKIGGDFLCTILVKQIGEPPIIIERVNGGLKHRFQHCKGSIYILNKDLFQAKDEIWKGEVVSEKPIIPIEEIKIPNIIKYIELLNDLQKIIIVPFCDRNKFVDSKNRDLVNLFQRQITNYPLDQRFINEMRFFHPDIVSRYDSVLPKRGFNK